MAYSFPVPTSEQIGKSLVADHQRNLAALAAPFPAAVSYAHFIKRDLAAAVEAGRCTVTMPHPAFASLPGVLVVDVVRMDDSVGYIVATADGGQWNRYGIGSLAVTWHDFGDTWEKLSPAMRRALYSLVVDSPVKPRWNTLRALEARGLVANDQLTPSARSLCQHHKGAFAHV